MLTAVLPGQILIDKKKSGTLYLKLGRPTRITQEIKDGVAGVIKFEPKITNLGLIPVKIIYNAYSSFLATCKVSVELNGKCLNEQWVKKIHNLFRTDIRYIFDWSLNTFPVEAIFHS
jgi:hypothetical protein